MCSPEGEYGIPPLPAGLGAGAAEVAGPLGHRPPVRPLLPPGSRPPGAAPVQDHPAPLAPGEGGAGRAYRALEAGGMEHPALHLQPAARRLVARPTLLGLHLHLQPAARDSGARQTRKKWKKFRERKFTNLKFPQKNINLFCVRFCYCCVFYTLVTIIAINGIIETIPHTFGSISTPKMIFLIEFLKFLVISSSIFPH